jgi:hypothetical protein
VAQSQEVDLDRPDVDWPRLVIACRKRIGVMINRLKDKLGEPIPGPERATWLFNRILLLLCLLRRLRTLPPASSVALDGHRRPASLVGVNLLREAFKVAMQGPELLGCWRRLRTIGLRMIARCWIKFSFGRRTR